MSDLTKPAQSDFIREMQRLHEAHRAALQGGDPETIQDAADELALFLRMHAQGRAAEWLASRQERAQ